MNADWKVIGKHADARDLRSTCSALAKVFSVQEHEVGLLRVRRKSLEFVYPPELGSAGLIPLSSSAVASQTATSKKPELFNNFTQVAHHSVFELVPLGTAAQSENPNLIQKLMSAPVVDDSGRVLGVVQISRKGATRGTAGTDFDEFDLEKLSEAARLLVPLLETLSATATEVIA